MRRLLRILWRLLLTVVALALVLGVTAFWFPQQVLTVDSGDVQGDAIVVLGGGIDQLRPERAAELFTQGKAPLVLISGTGDDQLCARKLLKNGVPESAIRVENRSMSTRENAVFSAPVLRQLGAHRVILVTTWYHSRRALACFRQAAPDLIFYSCPSYFCYGREEWKNHGMRNYINTEYVKLLGYWVRYGVWPWC